MKKRLTWHGSLPRLTADERLLTEREVAKHLGVSPKTVARHNLRPLYLGRCKRYRLSDVLSVLQGDTNS